MKYFHWKMSILPGPRRMINAEAQWIPVKTAGFLNTEEQKKDAKYFYVMIYPN